MSAACSSVYSAPPPGRWPPGGRCGCCSRAWHDRQGAAQVAHGRVHARRPARRGRCAGVETGPPRRRRKPERDIPPHEAPYSMATQQLPQRPAYRSAQHDQQAQRRRAGQMHRGERARCRQVAVDPSPGRGDGAGALHPGTGDDEPQRPVGPSMVQPRPGARTQEGSRRCETTRKTVVTPPHGATQITGRSRSACPRPSARRRAQAGDDDEARVHNAPRADDGRCAGCRPPVEPASSSTRPSRRQPRPDPPQPIPVRGGT